MRDSFKLGRIGGVPVGANWSLLALGATVAYILASRELPVSVAHYSGTAYWLAGIVTALALLVAVLAHELAHAVVARRAKLRVDGITLWFMGGVTRIEGDSDRPGTELLVAVVGPLVSGAVGGISLLLSSWATASGWLLAGAALEWLGAINLFLAVFNLLPASPLDGGRVFHGLVWLVTKNRWWATRLAAGAGVLLGCMCAAAGWLLFEQDPIDGAVLMVMAWFIIVSSKKESLMGRAHHVLGDVQVSDIMRPTYIAPGWLSVDTFWADWVSKYPEAAFLLERWGDTGWAGVVSAEQVAAVPPNLRHTVRARDVALPLPAVADAETRPAPLKPDDPALSIAGRHGAALLVEDHGRTVGVVLAPDIAVMVAKGAPVPRRTWGQAIWPAGVPSLASVTPGASPRLRYYGRS